jgi:hypothetical protein
MAIGILMALRKIGEEEAFDLLHLQSETIRRLLADSPSLSPEAVIGQAPLVQQPASGAVYHGRTAVSHQEHRSLGGLHTAGARAFRSVA